MTTVTLGCEHCGRTFERRRDNANRYIGTYCSRVCAGLSKRARFTVKCFNCGKRIEKPMCQSRFSRHFCNRACQRASVMTKRNCEACGSLFEIYKLFPNRFCSRDCSLHHLPSHAEQLKKRSYPNVPLVEVEKYLRMKTATRKVEQWLTQTK